MAMAPVSLIFLSVPVSSSALVCPAQTAAASARPIIPRRFIRSLLKMTEQCLHSLDRNGVTSSRDTMGPALQRLGQRMSRQPSHRLVGIRVRGIRRLGELSLQLRADRRVEVQSLGRDLLREPLVVQLLALAALVERTGSAIDP